MLNPPAHRAPTACVAIPVLSRQVRELRGSSIRMNCFGFPLYLGGGSKGERKLCISYWNNAGRMGVLYNVELVNCKKWQQWVTIVLWTECICEMNNNNLQWQVSVCYCLASRRSKVIVCTQKCSKPINNHCVQIKNRWSSNWALLIAWKGVSS